MPKPASSPSPRRPKVASSRARASGLASVSVHLVPSLLTAHELRGGVAVVIDVLRASTTICTALASGAEALYPVATTSDARALRQRLLKTPPRQPILLGGERAGVRIPGFDLDNSPASYSPSAVRGRTVIFTTTNGTAAALASQHAGAERMVFGCFANLSAVERFARACRRPIHLVCAGSGGAVSFEDAIFAGVLAARLLRPAGTRARVNDAAALAVLAAKALGPTDQARAAAAIAQAAHARTLRRLGFATDLRACAAVDSIPIVPEFDAASGRICASIGRSLNARPTPPRAGQRS